MSDLLKKIHFFNNTITTKIILLLIALITIPWIFLSFLYTDISNKKMLNEQLSNMNLANNRIRQELDSLLDDCKKTSDIVSFNTNIQNILRKKNFNKSEAFILDKEISTWLLQTRTIKNYILSFVLINKSGKYIYPTDLQSTIYAQNFESYTTLLKGHGSSEWFFNKTQTGNMLIFAKVINNINSPNSRIGLIVLFINADTIKAVLESNSIYETLITNKDGLVISASDKNNIFKNIETQPEVLIDNKVYNYHDNSLLRSETKLLGVPWTIISLKPKETSFFAGDSSTLTLFLISSLLWIMTLAMLSSYVIIKITNPIKKLRQCFKKVESGDFRVYYEAKSNDEIGQLAKSFNNMVFEVKDLISRVEDEKNKKKEMEIIALLSQINPHFLYNTLDMINWRIQQECEPGVISDLILSLSDYFRISLSKGENLILVENEIKHIENYLFLQTKAYEDKLRYGLRIDSDVLGLKMLRFLLQPLVENSIIHGILPKPGMGGVKVKGYKKDDYLCFVIIDNGNGMTMEKADNILKESKNNNTYGVKNVNDRIRLSFTDKYGLKFWSKPGFGTVVKLKLPLIYSE